MNVYDIETYTENEIVKPYCICYIVENKKEYEYYNNDFEDIIMKSFTNIVNLSKNSLLTFYIHNINFDGLLIISSLSFKNIQFTIIKKNLNIYSIKFEYLGNIFIFKCSYKILPLSLKNISIDGISKTSFPYKFITKENLFYIGKVPDILFFNDIKDYDCFKNFEFDFKKESIKYCTNDVVLLKKILEELLITINNINVKYIKYFKKSLSIPSFSNKIFYNFFNTYKIENKITLEFNSYLSNSYFGGRCEIFGNKKEEEIIHYFDYSGMYGQCMLQKFPIGSPKFDYSKNIKKCGFHYIRFKSIMDYPILPYKNKKLYFPNGEMEGIYWYEEIENFIKHGGVLLDVKYSIIYEKMEYVFKDFVNSFNEIKKKGSYYKLIGKLIINSLYGSFGMKHDNSFTMLTFSDYEFNEILKNLNVHSYYKINNCYVIKIYKDSKSKKIYDKNNKIWSDEFHERNVAYASIISSKARTKLYNAIMDVINDGGKPLYCDTDSIFSSYKINKINSKCGDDITWTETYDDGYFILPKTYILKNKEKEIIKFKGISKEKISFEEIKKMVNNNNIKFDNQMIFYKKNMILKQKFIEKITWLDEYDKRIFSKDKTSTTPIYIKDAPH